MPEYDNRLVERILAGDRRSIAQALSLVENRAAAAIPLLHELSPKAGGAQTIGVTGAPGAGKSTLVEKLAREFRNLGKRVGVLAVDPSSPFTGGAILGDRVRMQGLAEDPGIYIRSMATRGQMGGVAPTTSDALTVLGAAGCEVVLIETVGVGQDEVDIARLADVTVLLLVPGLGDDIQNIKAGVMEIADVYVINKADRPGADRVEQEVRASLSLAHRDDGWQPTIVKTVATTGDGIRDVINAIREFQGFITSSGCSKTRHAEQARFQLLNLLAQTVLDRITDRASRNSQFEQLVNAVVEHRKSPHDAVDDLIGAILEPLTAKIADVSPGRSVGVSHIGVAVESLAASVPVFERLTGQGPEAEEVVADQKVRVVSFQLLNSRIELLEGTSPESLIAKFVAKRGQGIHHIALNVPDLAGSLKALESQGTRLIDREPRCGADGEQIAFIHPSSTAGVLIELVERS